MSDSFNDGRRASHGNSIALACLNAEIDGFQRRMPRKALAAECDKSEQTFSKMTAGTQAFGITDLERLPRDLQVAWMKSYGKELGLTVRDIDPGEVHEQLYALVDQLATVARLGRIVATGKHATVKAELPRDAAERKRA